MLIKLLKYEFKATSRKLLPIYGVLIIFTIINKLTKGLQGLWGSTDIGGATLEVVKGISMFLQVASIIGVVAVTLYVILERFYKSFYGDEGYLTLTLPISPWKHLSSKLIISVFWTVVIVIIGALALIVNYYDGNIFTTINNSYEKFIWFFYINLGIDITTVIKLTLLALLAGLISEILMIYLSIIIGQLFFSKYKRLASFGAYLLISTVARAISFIPLLITGFTSEEQWLIANSYNNGLKILLIISLGTAVIFCIIYWTILEDIMSKKINLE